MGDRVSISFVSCDGNGKVCDESVSLFEHWGGQEFPKVASEWIKNSGYGQSPSDLITPFIRSLDKLFNPYFGKNPYDGDNSDNGHYRIDTKTGEIKKHQLRRVEKKPIPIDVVKRSLTVAINRLGVIQSDIERELKQLEDMD